jgi:hypothetical protein
MSVEAIQKIMSTNQQLRVEKKNINDKIDELVALETAIIDSVKKEFQTKVDAINLEYCSHTYDVDIIQECSEFLAILQKGKYIAVPRIPKWMTQIVGSEDCKQGEISSIFNGIWSPEEFQAIREYFSKLITNAKHCKATSQAEGRKTGYKSRDTKLEMKEPWYYLELIDENTGVDRAAEVEWFNEDEWLLCFDRECENIAESKWDWVIGIPNMLPQR